MKTRTRLIVASLAALLATPSYGQVLPKNRAPGKANPIPPATAPAPVAGETAGQVRREGREEARDARAETRADGAPLPQGRDAARATRQTTRQNIQASRAADYGVWFNARGNQGLVIDYLADKGVFATAGFQLGDQIVSIGGRPVTTEAQFVQFLSTPVAGAQAYDVVVLRGGQRQTLSLQPTALTQGIVSYDPFYQYGIVVDDRTPNQIIVQRVYPRTPAYYAGLRAGDVITTFGGQQIASVDAFSQSLAQANGMLDLGVTRNGQAAQVQLDSSSIRVDGSTQTTLRPNLDADRGRAAPGGTLEPRQDRPATLPAPGRGSERLPPEGAPRAPRGDAPERPIPPSGTTPATPATPAVPAVPATPATPAVPATPATPAVPTAPVIP